MAPKASDTKPGALDPTSPDFDPKAYSKLTPQEKAKLIEAVLLRTLNANARKGKTTP